MNIMKLIYLNGIIELLFLVFLFASIKFPVLIFMCLMLSVIAIIVNVKLKPTNISADRE